MEQTMPPISGIRPGLIMRVFAPTHNLVTENVAGVVSSVERALEMKLDGYAVYPRIDVLVLSDRRYVDCDCGETAARLRRDLRSVHEVRITEVEDGDPFCGALNYGLALQITGGVTHSTILSPGVRSYFTLPNVRAMFQAFGEGAYVAGMILKEFRESISAGRPLATLKTWDNFQLMRSGLYSILASQPMKNEDKETSWRWTPKDDRWVYTFAGVEEMHPLIWMAERTERPFIAPILPVEETLEWQVAQTIEVQAREANKRNTKVERQRRVAKSLSTSLALLEQRVMPKYRVTSIP